MHPQKFSNGFTLIELIVVMALISIMLFFSIPRFRQAVNSDSSQKVARHIMMQVPLLKDKAVREQKRYELRIDSGSNRIWVTNEAMNQDALDQAEESASEADPNIRLDVEYPQTGTVEGSVAIISFYKKGYSDKAIIHVEEEDSDVRISLLIEPFFSTVKLYETHESF